MKEEVIAALGEDFTLSPLSGKLKPNGRFRLIIDASFPYDKDRVVPSWIWNPDMPGSINSTIDVANYPATMSSVPKLVEVLWRAGRRGEACKMDWTAAYKHQAVSKEDLKLQVIEFGGRYFIELKLMFGTKSSPGIFDDLAKCFLKSVVGLVPGFSHQDFIQHLDDVIGSGLEGRGAPVWNFYETYRREAAIAGIRLDATGNIDKMQPPGKELIGLGVMFNIKEWTWRYKADKLARILIQLDRLRKGELIASKEMQSLVGKLVDVRPLVRGGRYNMLYMLRAAQQAEELGRDIVPQQELRDQASWWIVALQAANIWSPIVNPRQYVPSNAVEGWTDAAGGSLSHVGAGVGGLIPPFLYYYLPWPHWLNAGGKNSDGIVFKNKLSCLELLGPLILLSTCGDVVQGSHLRVYIDNMGAVEIFRKGHSTSCGYTSTIAKALYEIAEAIGARVTVEKITRCSDAGSYTADMLSKANFREFKHMMPLRESPREVPRSILRWIKDPQEDLSWSNEILKDMEKQGIEVMRL